MKSRWDSTMKRSRNVLNADLDPIFVDALYDYYIVPNYTEDRHYHTLKHIKYVLNALQDFKLSPQEKVKLELAIWFHDIVYDSQSYNNEVKSSEELIKFAKKAKIKDGDIDEIVKLILITKHSLPPRNKLEKIMCDCDLKGFVDRDFSKAQKNVRKEYSFLSDDEWIKGRSEFLITMLKKEHIFHTDAYRRTLEDAARHNLQKELDTINNN